MKPKASIFEEGMKKVYGAKFVTYIKCGECLAHYPDGNKHVCDNLMKSLVAFKKRTDEPKTRPNKNSKVLNNFTSYAFKHPEMRFWQALRNWAKVSKIYVEVFDKEVDDDILRDTWEWTKKNS